MDKLTKEQKADFEMMQSHWANVCKVADKEYKKPYSKNTEIVIADLKRAKEYLENNFGGFYWHPLMDLEV